MTKIKKLWLALLFFAMISAMAFSTTLSVSAASRKEQGDVNGDGSVTLEDVIMIRQHLAGVIELSDEQKHLADVYGMDGKVDLNDAIRMEQYLSGMDVVLEGENLHWIIYHNIEGATNANPSTYNADEEKITLVDASKEHYNFCGWYSDDEFKHQVTEIAVGTTGTVELYAKWEAIDYHIIYELDDGENNADNPNTYTVEDEILLKEPTKEYYDFVEWQLGGEKIEKIPVGWHGEKTLTAIWKPSVYTISYDANGGENISNPQTKYPKQDLTLSTIIPVREGYTFVGWNNLYEDTVYQAGEVFSGNLSLTFFAMWENNCSACNGMGYTSKTICDTCKGTGEIEYKQQEKCSLCNGTGLLYVCKSCGSGNIYAVISQYSYWVCRSCNAKTYDPKLNCPSCSNDVVYKKSCESCGGKGYHGTDGTCTTCKGVAYIKDSAPTYQTISDRSVVLTAHSGYEYSKDTIENKTISAPIVPDKEGYMGVWEDYTLNLQNITVNAVYAVITSSITLIGNGADNEINQTLIATYNAQMPIIDLGHQRTGYIFLGYYDAECGGVKYYNADLSSAKKWDKTNDTKLYAQWSADSYTITYELDGGENSQLNPNTYTIESNDIIFSEPIRKGYVFKGWYLADNSEITAIKQGSFGMITVYAKWEMKTYTITYHLDGGNNALKNPATYTIGDSISLKEAMKTGYTFQGWFINSSLTEEITVISNQFGDLKLYAKFLPNEYEITFNYNESDYVSPLIVTFDSNYNNGEKKLIELGLNETIDIYDYKPVRVGYIFMGWYYDSNYQQLVERDLTITADTILYAGWSTHSSIIGAGIKDKKTTRTGVIPEEYKNITINAYVSLGGYNENNMVYLKNVTNNEYIYRYEAYYSSYKRESAGKWYTYYTPHKDEYFNQKYYFQNTFIIPNNILLEIGSDNWGSEIEIICASESNHTISITNQQKKNIKYDQAIITPNVDRAGYTFRVMSRILCKHLVDFLVF